MTAPPHLRAAELALRSEIDEALGRRFQAEQAYSVALGKGELALIQVAQRTLLAARKQVDELLAQNNYEGWLARAAAGE